MAIARKTCRGCGNDFSYEAIAGRRPIYCDSCGDQRRRESKARYRASNRETIRAKNRMYATKVNRARGIFERGTPESSLRISEASRIKAKRGSDHHLWKGEAVGYAALHDWVDRYKSRTGVCEWCGANGKTQFANLSGEYRRDLNDFAEVCASCHIRHDRKRGSVCQLA